jgi:hypothetical protein
MLGAVRPVSSRAFADRARRSLIASRARRFDSRSQEIDDELFGHQIAFPACRNWFGYPASRCLLARVSSRRARAEVDAVMETPGNGRAGWAGTGSSGPAGGMNSARSLCVEFVAPGEEFAEFGEVGGGAAGGGW